MTNEHSHITQCDASSSPTGTGNHHHHEATTSRPPLEMCRASPSQNAQVGWYSNDELLTCDYLLFYQRSHVIIWSGASHHSIHPCPKWRRPRRPEEKQPEKRTMQKRENKNDLKFCSLRKSMVDITNKKQNTTQQGGAHPSARRALLKSASRGS